MFNVWYPILYCLHVATVVILVCSNSLDRFSSCAEKKGNIFLKYEHIIFLIYVLALPIDASYFSGCFFLLISIKINKSWKQSKQNGHLIAAAAAAHLAATKWILIQYTFCNEYFGHKAKYHVYCNLPLFYHRILFVRFAKLNIIAFHERILCHFECDNRYTTTLAFLYGCRLRGFFGCGTILSM